MEMTIEQQRAEAEAMAKMAQSKAGGRQSALPAALNNSMAAAQTGAMQGMTFGFGDEINAGMMTPIEMAIDAFQGKGFDPGRSYGQALEKSRGYDEATQAVDPTAATAGQIAGGIGAGLGLSGAGLTLMKGAAPTVLSMGTRGALEGAAYGALNGLGTGTDDKVGSAIDGALWGGAAGGLTGGVAGALASKSAQKAAPNLQALKDEAGALYDAARQSGAVLPKWQASELAGTIRGIASKEGIVTPTGRINDSFNKIADVVRSFDDYATGDLTVPQMQSARRLLQGALQSPDGNERRIAMEMMEAFHGYLDPIAPQIAQANQIYHRAMNAETLQTLVDVAQQKSAQYGRPLDATLREQFGALERQIIKGDVRGFSEAEKKAISEVARGGGIENFLRTIGKIAPAPNTIMGGSATVGAPLAVGTLLGNPVAGAAVGAGLAGTGMMARQGASALTANSAREAVVRSLMGGAPMPAANPAISRVAQALIAGGSTQAPDINPAILRALALN